MVYFYIIILLFFYETIPVVGSGGNVFGQTHFTDLEEFCAVSPVRISLNQFLPIQELAKNRFYITCIGWYGTSTNNQKMSGFFLPNEDVALTTTGGADYFLSGLLPFIEPMPTNKIVRDIDASIVGITNDDFFSVTSIIPDIIRKYIGFFGYYVLSYNEFNNAPMISFQIAMPLVFNKHVLKGKEQVYKGSSAIDGNAINDLLSGLSRPQLVYQRWNFSDQGMKNMEISHFECNISYNKVLGDIFSVETFLGVLFPGNKKDPYKTKQNDENRYVFFPQNMASQYYGFQWGTTINAFVFQNEFRAIKFIFGNNLLYFLPADQVRSFDLIGRSWSRYLPIYKNFNTPFFEETTLSNDLTYVCRVSPNFFTIITSELHYMKNKVTLGIGYCMYARQSESVTILEDIGNIFVKGTNEAILNAVSLVRTPALRLSKEDLQIMEKNIITQKMEPNNNYYYAKINNCMIDVQSATHPAVLAGELYAKGSLQIMDDCSIFGGIGSRWCHNNAIIDYGAAWVGIEITF